jgi:hypothetical protein
VIKRESQLSPIQRLGAGASKHRSKNADPVRERPPPYFVHFLPNASFRRIAREHFATFDRDKIAYATKRQNYIFNRRV